MKHGMNTKYVDDPMYVYHNPYITKSSLTTDTHITITMNFEIIRDSEILINY